VSSSNMADTIDLADLKRRIAAIGWHLHFELGFAEADRAEDALENAVSEIAHLIREEIEERAEEYA
jgi:hypothetical protein